MATLAPSDRPIYLDHHATTPLDPRVWDAMVPFWQEHFGNPGSAGHAYGWAAAAAIDQARTTLAATIGASPEEIVFTSGATEANNLAIKGMAEANLHRGRHIVTVVTEHNAILDPCRYLETLGFEVTYLPVDATGLISLADLNRACRPDTILVSVMAANNEIGVLQPLAAIGSLCRDRGIPFHTDAAQAIGKVPLNVEINNIDLMSLTAHKIHGPKGVGALYVRRRNPRITLAAQMHGGGQEGGRRSGTLCPPLIVGLAKAVELGVGEMTSANQRIGELRDRLWQQLAPEQSGLDILLNGHPVHRLPHTLNISVPGVDGADLVRGIQAHVALSSGSACTSHKGQPSHVLTALGRSPDLARASLRFGLGRFTTAAEIDQAAAITLQTIRQHQPTLAHSSV